MKKKKMHEEKHSSQVKGDPVRLARVNKDLYYYMSHPKLLREFFSRKLVYAD